MGSAEQPAGNLGPQGSCSKCSGGGLTPERMAPCTSQGPLQCLLTVILSPGHWTRGWSTAWKPRLYSVRTGCCRASKRQPRSPARKPGGLQQRAVNPDESQAVEEVEHHHIHSTDTYWAAGAARGARTPELDGPEVESQLYLFLAGWPWADYVPGSSVPHLENSELSPRPTGKTT